MKALLIRHATSPHQAPDALLAEESHIQAQDLVALRAGPLYAALYVRAQETTTSNAEVNAQKIVALDDLRFRATSTCRRIKQSVGALPSFVIHGNFNSASRCGVDLNFGYQALLAHQNPDFFEGHITTFERRKMEIPS